ncbi:hypothetical protein [Nostoc sp. UHCC 0870]|uniref:hypothetical protein n=1 Tax=Nostoc sp. UHCC 0870 TaxID=2914041 RepID=UPI001EDDF600|nr:hypothetical protein [Nostoc sp. UHCC 0870]UKO96537.1 hypothetical protein L6494_18195 [Nostoc sp. UHCC 0870]
MLKSTIKNITLVCSSLLTALIISQTANAQQRGLNVGAPVKIPPGQESQLLQFQLQNNEAGLRKMRVIPECVVGFGLSCNKTGGVVQKIIESNSGLTYQEMLMKAAGGDDNYRRFAGFYNNNPNLVQTPYTSFWRDSSPIVLDSHQYALGGLVSRRPVSGLGAVTQNFAWSPLKGENLRNGLLNFKYAFGRVFLEEASKIPDLTQQIRDLRLDPDMRDFYLRNLSKGLNALRTGNEAELKKSILEIMSRPYTPNSQGDGWYGRKIVQPPDNLVGRGEIVPGDTFADLTLPSVADDKVLDIAEIPGEEVFSTPSKGRPGLFPIFAGLGLLALFLLLLGGRNNPSSTARAATPSVPEITETPTPLPPDYVCPDLNLGGGSGNSGQVSEVQCDIPITQIPEVKKVVEPSALKAIILLTLILCLVNYKKRRRQQLT